MLTNLSELKHQRTVRHIDDYNHTNEREPLINNTPTTTNSTQQIPKTRWFKHLNTIDQGYFEHMSNALSYSWLSMKASFFFFWHAWYPDLFEWDGSNTIYDLNNVLKSKFQNINEMYNTIN